MSTTKRCSILLLFSFVHSVRSELVYRSVAPGCGITAGKDIWTATTSIAIDNINIFDPIISIETALPLIICTIDLTVCSPDNLIESGDGCFCQINANNYDIVIRQTAIKEHSNQELVGVYKCRDSRMCVVKYQYAIGQLPLVYELAVASYKIRGCRACSGCQQKFLPQSSTATVGQHGFIILDFCVANLQPGSVVAINDLKLSRHSCVSRVLEVSGHIKIQLSYNETRDCRRTGNYTLDIDVASDGCDKQDGN